MNTSAVAVFYFSGHIHWMKAGIAAVAAIAGGLIGVQMLQRVNEKYLRIAVIALGVVLTLAMFIKY